MKKTIFGGLFILVLISIGIQVKNFNKPVSQEEFQKALGKSIGMTRVPFCPTPSGKCSGYVIKK